MGGGGGGPIVPVPEEPGLPTPPVMPDICSTGLWLSTGGLSPTAAVESRPVFVVGFGLAGVSVGACSSLGRGSGDAGGGVFGGDRVDW
jgi:hypothetical protein